MSDTIKAAHQKELFGHPVGLCVLFFTEMWRAFFLLWNASIISSIYDRQKQCKLVVRVV